MRSTAFTIYQLLPSKQHYRLQSTISLHQRPVNHLTQYPICNRGQNDADSNICLDLTARGDGVASEYLTSGDKCRLLSKN